MAAIIINRRQVDSDSTRRTQRPESPTDPARATVAAAELVVASQARGGTLFVAGNGGSMADALHIAGELAKDFERPHPLPAPLREQLDVVSGSTALSSSLQAGVRVVVLGANPVLASAIDNDFVTRHAGFAQELYTLARPGDALLAISTSGRSQNLLHAVYLARATEVAVIALTGPHASPLTHHADIVIAASGDGTAAIQTSHVALYHDLCRHIEHLLTEP